MIVNEDFLSRLRRSFNLNLYEVKLWTALLSRGISTAGELSDIADVPRSRTYDVLESLERKGFIIVKPEKPIRYLAISPSEILDRVKRRLEESANRQTIRLEKLKQSDILKELLTLYTQGIEPMHPSEFSGALKGRHNLYDHIAFLIKESQKSVSIVTTEDGFVRKMRSFRPLLEKATNRGVQVRIVAPATRETEMVAEKLKGIIEFKATDFPARFCVIDNKHVMFMMVDDKEVHPSYDLAMWVNAPYFAKTLSTVFDGIWNGYNKPDIQEPKEPIDQEVDINQS